jgi:hypothetical protein
MKTAPLLANDPQTTDGATRAGRAWAFGPHGLLGWASHGDWR